MTPATHVPGEVPRSSIDPDVVRFTDVSGRPLRTAKSEQTKVTIMTAARRVFEQRGYKNTRVADIVQVAGSGHGTFYRYFKSKEDVFRALSDLVRDGLLQAQKTRMRSRPRPVVAATSADRPALLDDLRTTMANYLADFRRDARLIELLDEVAASDGEVRRARIEVFAQLEHETTESLRDLVAMGVCPADLDVEYTALLIRSMVDRCAYRWFVLGLPVDDERALDALVQGVLRLSRWSFVDDDLGDPPARAAARWSEVNEESDRPGRPGDPG